VTAASRCETAVTLQEQVLFNVPDNAAKYASSGSAINLRVWRDEDRVHCT
jgi:K+-sensing histidine kinase KdpD